VPQSPLLACPSCSRHVRASEASCPFCGASVVVAARGFVPRQEPKERLGRAALYAFGVGSLTVATACSSSSSVPTPPYGTAPFDAGHEETGASNDSGRDDARSGDDASDDADEDAPTIQPMYGIAFDAARAVDAGEDAGDDASDANVAVHYGVPFDAH
jgi:hypothetical protein